jgi:hypothetical protein
MIQRLQSLWLLVAALLSFSTLRLSFFSGNIIVDNVKQFQRFSGMSSIFIMILTVGVAVASIIAIFLYKDRKLQLKIILPVLLVSLLNLFLYFQNTNNFIPTDWSYDLSSLISAAIPIFLMMAIYRIYKDEKLVKSVDRLR